MKVKWENVGVITVDSGLCWIGDPCYVIHNDKQKALGKTWDTFCNKLGKKYPTRKQFKHDPGHAGLGVCTSTGYGDGTYEVMAKIIEDKSIGKRIAELRIIFINENEYDEDV